MKDLSCITLLVFAHHGAISQACVFSPQQAILTVFPVPRSRWPFRMFLGLLLGDCLGCTYAWTNYQLGTILAFYQGQIHVSCVKTL